MKLVIQRINQAEVFVEKKPVAKIGSGLFVLLAVGPGDTEEKASFLAEKLAKLRIMSDSAGKMNLSVKEVKAELLIVSQFTLYGDCSKGNRPSFVKAAQPEKAQKLYEHFVNKLKNKDLKVQTGSFGQYMKINCSLDGPVTILLEE